MKRMISALLATVAFVSALGVANAAYDIDKIRVPRTGWEEKSSIFIYRKFKGIVTNTQTDPKYGIYDRFVSWTMTADEKKFLATLPESEQVRLIDDMKWMASIKWRLEQYGRVGERAWANKMAVAKGTEKPFEFIEKAYGKDAYAWIVANKKALDSKFSTYVEGEREKLRAGTLKSDHSNAEAMRIPTYEVYVGSMGIAKLEAMKAPGSTVRRKAMADYFEYLLITDGRLYFK